jgi:hypothetical protein
MQGLDDNIGVQANGQQVEGDFDNGADVTIYELVGSESLGSYPAPNVHLIPMGQQWSYMDGAGGTTKCLVTGIALTLGRHRLADVPMDIINDTGVPTINLGRDVFRDRTLFFSPFTPAGSV